MTDPIAISDKLLAIIDAYCDGTLPDSAVPQLETYLKNNPVALDYFLDYCHLHSELYTEQATTNAMAAVMQQRLADSKAETSKTPVLVRIVEGQIDSLSRNLPKQLGLAAILTGGLVALLMIVLSAMYTGNARVANHPVSERPHGIARLISVEKARWKEGLTRKIGTRFYLGDRITLETGYATLLLDRGAYVLLEGPAEFQFKGPNAGFLEAGKLTALLTKKAKGLCINTPSCRIVDVGTEFGAEVDPDGATTVYVMTGSVDVSRQLAADQYGTPTRLTIGQSLALSLDGRISADKNIPPEHFRRVVSKAKAPITAYQTAFGTLGNQTTHRGSLGMDFIVNLPIEVTALGVFDSGSDGLRRPLVAELWSRNDAETPDLPRDDTGGAVLIRQEFSANAPGTLQNGSRFKTLTTPVLLRPGDYTIVAFGYGPDEPNVNYTPDTRFKLRKPLTNSGKGTISFVGSSRYGKSGEFPRTIDEFSEIQYSAGTFQFQTVPSKTSDE